MMKMKALAKVTLALALPLAIAACSSERIKAPRDPGVCFYIAEQPDGSIRNNVVARDIKNIEQCAAELERMRIRFLRLGGGNDEILGAYQGNFVFMTREGIFTAKRLEGMRYLLMVRVNGKLVMPGAVVRQQPNAPNQLPAPEQK
jgi:hypothetical protein